MTTKDEASKFRYETLLLWLPGLVVGIWGARVGDEAIPWVFASLPVGGFLSVILDRIRPFEEKSASTAAFFLGAFASLAGNVIGLLTGRAVMFIQAF